MLNSGLGGRRFCCHGFGGGGEDHWGGCVVYGRGRGCPMKMLTVVAMVAACFAYILLILPLARGRAQASPAAPEAPSVAFPAMPALAAMAAVPAAPVVSGGTAEPA